MVIPVFKSPFNKVAGLQAPILNNICKRLLFIPNERYFDKFEVLSVFWAVITDFIAITSKNYVYLTDRSSYSQLV